MHFVFNLKTGKDFKSQEALPLLLLSLTAKFVYLPDVADVFAHVDLTPFGQISQSLPLKTKQKPPSQQPCVVLALMALILVDTEY